MKEILFTGPTGNPVVLHELDLSIPSSRQTYTEAKIGDLRRLRARKVDGDAYHWQIPDGPRVGVESGTILRLDAEARILGELKQVDEGERAEKVIFGIPRPSELEAAVEAAEHIIFQRPS